MNGPSCYLSDVKANDESARETKPDDKSGKHASKYQSEDRKKAFPKKPHSEGAYKKPWSKDAKSKPTIAHDHHEQKALRVKRKEGNPTFELVTQLKSKWEQARVKVMDKSKRKTLIDEIMTMIAGKVHDVRFNSDLSCSNSN